MNNDGQMDIFDFLTLEEPITEPRIRTGTYRKAGVIDDTLQVQSNG